MKIKIIAFVVSFLLVSMHIMAQTSIAIVGGLNVQNLNGTNSNGDKYENDLVLGFHGGLNAMIPIAPDFYFNPGLLFTTKGASNQTAGVTGTYRLNYLELPLNLAYRAQVGSGFVLFGFGPYVAYALGGKAKFEGDGVSLERDIVFQNTIEPGDGLQTYFKPLDAGANIFFGYELAAGLYFQLNAQLGLLNIHPEDKRVNDDKTTARNTGFGLSVGFRF